MAATGAANQAILLKIILGDMGKKKQGSVELYCDNKSAIAIVKNPVYYSWTKHIAINYHYLREVKANNKIQLKFCNTEEQLANILTKALPRDRF